MADVHAEIEATAAQFTAALGGDLNEAQRYQVRRAAQLGALANSLRAKAVAGEAIDIAELGRIEGIASEAINALGITSKSAAEHLDCSVLDDTELAEFERLMEKCLRSGPNPVEPTPHEVQLAEARADAAKWHEEWRIKSGECKSAWHNVKLRNAEIEELRATADPAATLSGCAAVIGELQRRIAAEPESYMVPHWRAEIARRRAGVAELCKLVEAVAAEINPVPAEPVVEPKNIEPEPAPALSTDNVVLLRSDPGFGGLAMANAHWNGGTGLPPGVRSGPEYRGGS
jgi:hypothetical protein